MDKKQRYARLLFRDKAKGDRVLDRYIHHRNLYNKGQAELGFFRNLVSYQAILVTYLAVDRILAKLGWSVSMWIIFMVLALLVVLKVGFQWYVGYWWDKHQVFDREADWGNKRNLITKAISQKLLDGGGLNR